MKLQLFSFSVSCNMDTDTISYREGPLMLVSAQQKSTQTVRRLFNILLRRLITSRNVGRRTASPPPPSYTFALGMDVNVCVCALRQGQRHTCTSNKGRQMSSGNTTPLDQERKKGQAKVM